MAGLLSGLFWLFVDAMDWRYFLGMTPAFMLSAIVTYASESGTASALTAANVTAEVAASASGHAAAMIGVMTVVSLCTGGVLFAMRRGIEPSDLTKSRMRE